MSIALFILAIIFALGGIVSLISPLLPGPIFSYIGYLLYYFSDKSDDSLRDLIVWGIFMIVASVIDTLMSPVITKKFGGSKKAVWGSFLGTIVGSFFFPPIGMLLGAFVGALLGEMRETNKLGDSEFKVAFGSFLGFITGTGLKLIYCIFVLWHIIF
ncbi:MAG: DUF456 domain-containing protein [Rikenellaceae bacterium]